mgnify:CR=1 FL=1
MKYTNPDIESSYRDNDLGKTLYDLVLKYKPKKIVEHGVLFGYSTVAMAQALDELGGGHIYAYDLFDTYSFKHATMEETQANINRYNVSKYVTLAQKDFNEWLKDSEDFDMMHIDISNKGDTIEQLYEVVKEQVQKGAIVLFEGGSEERDNVEWMIKYNCKKIREAKVPFEVIDERFPSLSMIKKI